ncbi:polyisoprenyl-teichoic acid--peptidoglycan teichoic acid transferase TagU [Niallia taxi]|uniref:Polyisoprenyl-teichoic acid--peptidoglycan teichoic acid transferase TagU n=1 Tax=Niallia taxi TaxID=2499688 RepID=A0A3S2TXR8_9BACI|nr:LytR family transcriptional regulator [Niallia taxi]MCM3216310.1 LytR family transcriptional regulator [Niallia taxi]MED4039202.1 LytR family transcriptional regulator [Niallia taxi]MED4054276.1 LytR family transcriptional regulator [Niallia taxi]MED4118204.1 LytR family transcriptional regulator [Niallia taxi]RVT63767.1 LytR family transcriptional regulator [Niallia taxi]
MRSEKPKKKKRKWLRITGLILLILLIGIGVYGYTIWNSLTSAVDSMHEPVDRETTKRTETLNLEQQEPFSVLMLGVDERDGDSGRSDTMIVMTVNPEKKSVKMLSIPRDTRTEIVGHGTTDKINHAYAFGGVAMSMDTVENFLDIPIDYYMQINMEGFKDIVDSVGGVTVNNDLDFTYEGVHFPKGEVTLNGEKALKFSRMRYEDPRGDFGRQLRQRLIIQAVLKEGASLNSLTNFDDIFAALSKNIKTNLTFDEMVNIQKNYKQAAGNIEQFTINGTGQKIDGIWYLLVDDAEKTKIQTALKDHLSVK